jgi:hypothetical protein
MSEAKECSCNGNAITSIMYSFAYPTETPWIERFDIVSSEPLQELDVDNDFQREAEL